jgi:hypothetical protein
MPREDRTFALTEAVLPEELFFEIGFPSMRDDAGAWLEAHGPRLREVAGRLASQSPTANRVVVVRAQYRLYLSEFAMRVARGERMWKGSSRSCSLGDIPVGAQVVIGEAVDDQALRARG